MARFRDSASGWSLPTRLLHWTMAGLIIHQIWLGVWMTNFVPDLIDRFRLTQSHKNWGVVLLGLLVVRLFWRSACRWRRPPMPTGMPRWQRQAAAWSHRALYLLLLAMPLSGWILVSASPLAHMIGLKSKVFGRFVLPDPIGHGSHAIEHAAGGVHIASAIALGVLLAVHVVAALRHQFGARDGVLTRMISG